MEPLCDCLVSPGCGLGGSTRPQYVGNHCLPCSLAYDPHLWGNKGALDSQGTKHKVEGCEGPGSVLPNRPNHTTTPLLEFHRTMEKIWDWLVFVKFYTS